ncbi:MAG: glycosyltransferase family 61 protein [Opitutus sp.]
MLFRDGTGFSWQEQSVARIPDARIVTVHGWCVALEDTFLGDFSFGGNRRTSFVYSLTVHRAPRPLKGVTLNLCSAHAVTNFCHWLLDAVSRLELVDRCGISLTEVDHILLPRFPGGTAAWVLERLNLPADKLIRPDVRDHFRCETLLQPSYPGFVASYPAWVVEFYRKHFPAPTVEAGRLLYIPRKGKRGLVNEAEVEEELLGRGIQPFEPAGEKDLEFKLADVSHLVGVHGAALANLVFCRPGTRVLELIPSDTPWPFYYSLCSSAGMPYGVIVGKSLRERRRKTQVPTQSPFTVPIDELRGALDVLLATRASRKEEVSAPV